MKKESFLKGAAVLGIAGIIIKVLGAFFRIPLARFIGSEGMGYYQVGYPLYTFLLAFSSQGFPTAISKLVAEKRAKGEMGAAHKVFKTSLKLLVTLGLICTLILAGGARFLVDKVVKSPNAYYSVMALAPALLLVSAMAAYRGYFQGMKNMTPTALSQIAEQIGRVFLGLGLAVFLLNYGIQYAAAGAALGAAIGGFFGLALIMLIYFKNKKRILSEFDRLPDEQEVPSKAIIRDLLKISIPITVGGAVMPLINIIDTMIVLRRLQAIGFSYEEANQLFGQMTGMANTLINLPQVFTVALAMSIVPVISEAAIKSNWESVQRDTQSAFRVSLLIGLPAATGLALLSGPIMTLLFPAEPASAGEILLFSSMGVFFLTQVQTLTGILQGVGKQSIPVKNLMIGALVKLIATYTLTGIPALNVKGAALGTVSAYLVAAFLDLRAVIKHTGVTFDLGQFFLKPMGAVLSMGVVVALSYRGLNALMGNSIATLGSIALGVVVYGVALIMTGAVTQADLDLIPGGKRLKRFVRR